MEVKVGDNPLDPEQVDGYHTLAREEGFDALLTISNQAALANGQPAVALDGRRLRATPVVHFSWDRLLADARVLCGKKQIADPDQAWMLNEWIKYVADGQSRIVEPPALGKHWNAVVAAARESKLAAVSAQIEDVVGHWDAFLRKAALRLRAKLGVDVQPRASRAEVKDPAIRAKRMHTDALSKGILAGALQVPDAIGDLDVELLLHGRVVRYSLVVKPPTEGRLKTRLTWLLRQLATGAPHRNLVVRVEWDQRRLFTEAPWHALQDGHAPLLLDANKQPIPSDAMPRVYRLTWTTPFAKGRGRSGGHILEGISTGLERFYRDVIERMTPFVPKAPKLPPEPTASEEPASLSPQPVSEDPSPSPPWSKPRATAARPEEAKEHESQTAPRTPLVGTRDWEKK